MRVTPIVVYVLHAGIKAGTAATSALVATRVVLGGTVLLLVMVMMFANATHGILVVKVAVVGGQSGKRVAHEGGRGV